MTKRSDLPSSAARLAINEGAGVYRNAWTFISTIFLGIGGIALFLVITAAASLFGALFIAVARRVSQ
jgi:hypothetical protein